jgi:ADP-ribosylglycohydrolase
MHPVGSHHHVVAHADAATVRKRASAAVLGAVTADCASLGAHWVYDQAKIAEVVAAAGGAPEFVPCQTAYHAARQPGDTTMLGETALVTLRSLADKKAWNRADFGAKFLGTFGPGGSYVGYADGVVKGTVMNILSMQVQQRAVLTPPAGVAGPAVGYPSLMKVKVTAETSGDMAPEAVAAAAEAVVREADPAVSADAVAWIRDAALRLASLAAQPVGADDNQSPGLAKLPAIVARYAGHKELTHIVNESVRATQNNDDAVAWLVPVARIIEAVILGASPSDAVKTNLVHFEQPYRSVVEAALHAAAGEADYLAVLKRFGTSCGLVNTVPGALYLAVRHGAEGLPGYVAAVRENILAGGDSAGRAMLLGALLGAAAGGVPDEWLARVRCHAELTALTAGIHDDAHAPLVSDHVEVHRAGAHAAAAAATQ